ncbi:hypothetical protein GGI17_006542, partial [Coemansia sp. S146]
DHVVGSSRQVLVGIKPNSDEWNTLLKPLLWVCHSFRAVAYPLYCSRYKLVIANLPNYRRFLKGRARSPFYLGYRLNNNLGYPIHHLAKTLDINIDEVSIYSGDALKMLSRAPYDGCAFPLVGKIDLLIVTDRTLREGKKAKKNVVAFVQRVKGMAPNVNNIWVLPKDYDTPRYNSSSIYGSLVSQLFQLASRIQYCEDMCLLIKVNLELDRIDNLVHIKYTAGSDDKSAIKLARQNLTTLESLIIHAAGSVNVPGIIWEGDDDFVTYPHFHTLKLSGNPGYCETLDSVPTDVVPFPKLRCLKIDYENAFGDDVVFRGNAATLESLDLDLSSLTVSVLRQYGVFTPSSHPKLCYVRLWDKRRYTPRVFATNAEALQFAIGIGPTAHMRYIAGFPNGAKLIPTLSQLNGLGSIQFLNLNNTAFAFWDVIALIKILPMMSDLTVKPTFPGPLPYGITLDKLPAYTISTYASMGKRFSMYANNFNRRGRGSFGSESASRGRTPRSYVWSWKPVRDGDRNCHPTIADFVNQHAHVIERDRNNILKRMTHLLSTMSVTELKASGYAVAGLRIAEQCSTSYGDVEVRLEAVSEDLLPPTVMRIGDIVCIDDAANDDAIRSFDLDTVGAVMGTIGSIGPSELIISLGSGQKIPAYWSNGCSILKLIFDVPFKRMLIALRDLANYPCTRPSLQQVVFLGTEPRFYGQVLSDSDFVDGSLNQLQKDSVQLTMTANVIALIHGPPGTGKTRVLIEIICQLLRRKQRVLVCGPSNVSVDNITKHLASIPDISMVRSGHPSRISSDTMPFSLDSLKARSAGDRDSSSPADQSVAELTHTLSGSSLSASSFSPHAASAGAMSNSAIIRSKRVVLSTLSNAGGRDLRSDCGDFDVVIIDDSIQGLKGESWIAALKAPKLILASDSNQLYPMLINADGVIATANNDLGSQLPQVTLFEHHVEANDYTRAPLVLMDMVGCGIMESSDDFETFGGTGAMNDGSESRTNMGEVQIAMAHVKKLVAAGVDIKDIAVLSFYDAQVALLKCLSEECYPELEIGSVDAFQGREKEAVVLSMVRSNHGKEVGFLKDVRRMNVALTRARRHLCIIADSSTVSEGDPFLKALFTHLKAKALVIQPSA